MKFLLGCDMLKLEGDCIQLVRKVAKSGNVYMITIPPDIGKALHKKLVLVTIRQLKIED